MLTCILNVNCKQKAKVNYCIYCLNNIPIIKSLKYITKTV